MNIPVYRMQPWELLGAKTLRRCDDQTIAEVIRRVKLREVWKGLPRLNEIKSALENSTEAGLELQSTNSCMWLSPEAVRALLQNPNTLLVACVRIWEGEFRDYEWVQPSPTPWSIAQTVVACERENAYQIAITLEQVLKERKIEAAARRNASQGYGRRHYWRRRY